MNNLQVMAGQLGTKVVNNTTELTQDSCGIVVLEDTIFTSIKVAGVDKKSDYITNTSIAIKAGAIFRPIGGGKFSGVKLASGSVSIILIGENF
jgi:hypothetical protein